MTTRADSFVAGMLLGVAVFGLIDTVAASLFPDAVAEGLESGDFTKAERLARISFANGHPWRLLDPPADAS